MKKLFLLLVIVFALPNAGSPQVELSMDISLDTNPSSEKLKKAKAKKKEVLKLPTMG